MSRIDAPEPDPSEPPNRAVVDYFSARAADYHADSLRWPWSWLRRRESAAVRELIGDVRNRHGLDLGCGAGFYTRLMLDRGAASVCAVDLTSAMIERLPRSHNVTGVVANAASVDLEQRFDRIIVGGMLEFTPDPEAVLSNARRLSTEDAVLVVLTPDNRMAARAYEAFHRQHGIPVRLFCVEDLRRIAGNCGWRVVQTQHVWPFTNVARLLRD